MFALIGLALGLTVAREGKLASFVIGVLVIFAYYIVMFLSESLTKGHYLNMYLTRWMPNILLGAFRRRRPHLAGAVHRRPAADFNRRGDAAHREGPRPVAATRERLRQVRKSRRTAPLPAAGRPARVRGAAPVLVIRLPRVRLPAPGLLDRYISRIYVKIVGLSFFALLGLFYISTFLDRSDKIFKGQTNDRGSRPAAGLPDAAVRLLRHPDCRAAQPSS